MGRVRGGKQGSSSFSFSFPFFLMGCRLAILFNIIDINASANECFTSCSTVEPSSSTCEQAPSEI